MEFCSNDPHKFLSLIIRLSEQDSQSGEGLYVGKSKQAGPFPLGGIMARKGVAVC